MTEAREGRDPVGCLEDLREALAQAELDEFDAPGPAGVSSEGARTAAYDLAVALGRCRLFGVEPGDELDGTLPGAVALAAASVLEGHLRGWAEEARTLGQHWDETADPVEAEDLCL